MAVIGSAILDVVLGAAGMEFLRTSKPEMVEKAEDGIKRFVRSMRLSKSDDKKVKAK
jgi:hypothetical protein